MAGKVSQIDMTIGEDTGDDHAITIMLAFDSDRDIDYEERKECVQAILKAAAKIINTRFGSS